MKAGALSLLLALVVTAANAAEWQWSVPVEAVVSKETGDRPRAFLYIPPGCARVRGVVVGQHNMLEEGVLEHPFFRKALADTDMAEVWVTPGFDLFFRYDQGAGESFEAMMKALAEESGYSELQWAPVVPIGHSAADHYPYHFAAWKPARTLAAISCKGFLPQDINSNTPAGYDTKLLAGVPLLLFSGEYEDAKGRAGRALSFRNSLTNAPMTMCADPGGGHFDYHDRMVAYIALYLKKAARFRLPDNVAADGPVALKPVDATTQGWLVDRWRPDMPAMAPPAPVGAYTGDPKQAFWCFDEELARATDAYQAQERGKKPQLVGFIQAGEVVAQNPALHAQVQLKFLPQDDGLTFKLNGTFLDRVPVGRPVGWSGLPQGSPIEHSGGGSPVVLSRITGPVVQIAPDTFAIRFNRVGFSNRVRSANIWLMAVHPGDTVYKRAVQQANLQFPLHNTEGTPQTINFPEIPARDKGADSVKLHATSDAGVPVYYYVREGPAELDGDILKFTAIPPRSKYPLKVTVVAWQWGRSIAPKLKSAEPVERTILIAAP